MTGTRHVNGFALRWAAELSLWLTGFGQPQDREKALRAGFDAHLTKPADEAALAGALGERRPASTVAMR